MTRTLEPFEKTSWEKYDIDFDFTSKLPPAATAVVSATVSAKKYEWPNGEVTTDNTVFVTTSATIVDDVKARVTVKSGSDGYAYTLICQAVLDNGQQVEHAVLMRVIDN